MKKTFDHVSFALALISLSSPVLSMETPKDHEHSGIDCSSIAVRAEFDSTLKTKIFTSFKPAFEKINGKNNSLIFQWNGEKIFQGNNTNQYTFRHKTADSVFFRFKPDVSYHVSLCVVLPAEEGKMENQKLGLTGQVELLRMAKEHLQPTTMVNEVKKTGHIFEFLTMVHSYDFQGDQVNKTYTNGIGLENLSLDFPEGISHVHFGLRHGTCGMVKKRVEDFLIPSINNQKQFFKNKYEGTFDTFTGHITIAKMDKSQGKDITFNSTRFRSACVLPNGNKINEYQIIYKVHTELKQAFDLTKENFDVKGTVPFDRISMRGLIFVNGVCTFDPLLKNDISK